MSDFHETVDTEIFGTHLPSPPETGTENPLSTRSTRLEDEKPIVYPSSAGDEGLFQTATPVAVMTEVSWLDPNRPLPNQYVWDQGTVDLMPPYDMSILAGSWNPASNLPAFSHLKPTFDLQNNPEDSFLYEKGLRCIAYGQDLPPICEDFEDDFSDEEGVPCIAQGKGLPTREDLEIMDRHLPFRGRPLEAPELFVSADYRDKHPLCGPNDDRIYLNHGSEVENLSGSPKNRDQAKSNPPRPILEIFRAEEGWRPAPKGMFTTWEFGAVGERLLPPTLPNPTSDDAGTPKVSVAKLDTRSELWEPYDI
ncbi:hypothetical protein PV08_11111 [Exophiala spinifera]|uniref:Uncharacterized protein n=1 Tax=Exophiala spinifera TaxID=91928 RepID=A0A0D2AUH7_9EURO|nr:uncharacterized protein PV08_11111 [Exophiala spinifera]KIW10150.1 hypothetical protein PV08_11111 [Exophiala spinifera]